MQDYSRSAMFAFLDYVGNKHLVNQSTARNWKSASSQFLELLDDTEAGDLRNLDIEHLGQRYAHSKGNSVKPDSLRMYLVRFKGAHENFISYAENKLAYRPSLIKNRQPNVQTKDKRDLSSKRRNTAPEEKQERLNSNDFTDQEKPNGIIFPIPISGGRIVTVSNLPYELKKIDADKISAVIQALAQPEPQN